MSMTATEAIQQLRTLENEHLELDVFLTQAIRFIPLFVTKQVRYKVTDIPTKRTIQYYVHKGLISKPGRRGRRIAFSYRHLLQVLAVKKLQNDYLPLRKIAEIMRSSSERELEDILIGERRVLSPLRPSDSPSPNSLWTSWRRVRIDDHIELSVQEGFDLLDPSIDLDVINAKIINALSVLSLPGADWTAYDSSASPHAYTQDEGLCFVVAPPVASLKHASVALITEGGLVPKGNPDGLEPSRASRYLKYSIAEVDDMSGGAFESIDLGWDTIHVNADPNRLVPLDVMREFEREGLIGKTHRYLYTTTGVATTVDAAHRVGKNIAADLKSAGISAAILTAT
jgi:DNA-binding transcriptional MerR regulator